jgi:hypothetical protein
MDNNLLVESGYWALQAKVLENSLREGREWVSVWVNYSEINERVQNVDYDYSQLENWRTDAPWWYLFFTYKNLVGGEMYRQMLTQWYSHLRCQSPEALREKLMVRIKAGVVHG